MGKQERETGIMYGFVGDISKNLLLEALYGLQ